MSALRIAVVSDLHVFDHWDPGEPWPSHARVGPRGGPVGKNPLHDLIGYVERNPDIRADLLLCPGDLTHQAQEKPLQHTWELLQELGAKLGVSAVIGTSGNHDLDSRFVHNAYDPKEVMQNLIPPFPTNDDVGNLYYWAKHFTYFSNKSARVVVLNSCAYHTGRITEIEHGRISKVTIEALKHLLQNEPQRDINVFLCHHPPQVHMEHELGDRDQMINGQLLLDMLGGGEYGKWILIHGHKHHGKLTYASGGSLSPVVLAAGSLSIVLHRHLHGNADNQFYIVDCAPNAYGTQKGWVNAWDWTPGSGWDKARASSVLPRKAGFGCRRDPGELARDVATAMAAASKASWDSIAALVPDVLFLVPTDARALLRDLQNKHEIAVTFLDEEPYELVKVSP